MINSILKIVTGFIGIKGGTDGTIIGNTADSMKTLVTATVLPPLASTSTLQVAEAILIGAVTETAPANDTASSGLNGRLQRIAQNLTSIDAGIPTALGIQVKANSMSVAIASDQVVPTSITVVDLVGNAPQTATIVATSGAAVAANAARKGLIIRNVSINKISLGLDGNAAVLNSGITLYPGDAWNMDSYDFTVGAIAAIASAAGSVISIQEFQ